MSKCPDVFITAPVLTKLWTVIESLKTEVGGFGRAKWVAGDSAIIWDDVFLVPQTVSQADVDFTGSGIAAAVERAATNEWHGDPNVIWVSWHSHHTMKAFWSSTDESCIKTYAATGIPTLLSFVGCHDHEYKLRLDFFEVEHHGITIPQITMDDLGLSPDPADDVLGAIMDEIDLNVKKYTAPPPTKKWEQSPPKGKPPANNDGLDIGEAFEVKELMDDTGMTYNQAVDLVQSSSGNNRFLVGPHGVIDTEDLEHEWDQMAQYFGGSD